MAKLFDKLLSRDEHVCPWWLAWSFDNPLRKWLHDPKQVLGPFVKDGMTAADIGCGMGYFSVALAELVGRTPQASEGRYRTVLLLRSGEQRLAVRIDALEGNFEAVVKNIGPQLARIAGISGATVLGDGRVALIINPFQLAERAPRREIELAPPEEVQAPLVLVVDDSLTVRKITTRFLQREGFRVARPKGILLYGPPGCGKTLLAAATAAEIEGYFINVDAAAMMSKWLGEAEKNVSKLFTMARKLYQTENVPILLFIDEIDSLLGTRNSEVGGEVRVKNQFLTEMDGINGKSKESQLYVIGATNKPWSLEVSFLRRFQKRIYVTLPEYESRINLFTQYTRPLTKEKNLKSDELLLRLLDLSLQLGDLVLHLADFAVDLLNLDELVDVLLPFVDRVPNGFCDLVQERHCGSPSLRGSVSPPHSGRGAKAPVRDPSIPLLLARQPAHKEGAEGASHAGN